MGFVWVFFVLVQEELYLEFSFPPCLPVDLCLKLLKSPVVNVKDIKLLRSETKESCKPSAVSTSWGSVTQHKCIRQVSRSEMASQHKISALLS